MKSWLHALSKTRDKIAGGLSRLMSGLAKPDPVALDAWERELIEADISPRLVGEWMTEVRRRAGREDIREVVRGLLLEVFPPQDDFKPVGRGGPTVVLITGVNGSGKTTSAAKLGYRFKQDGYMPLLAAADTFRAAGSHQLKVWADRLGVDVVVGQHGGDAAAVVYDAVQAGVARKADVVLVDTAGRMHTKQPLMEELQKVRRAAAKALPGAPHECWIVLDATLGHNAVSQARVFKECVELTGVIVAKLDGSSKGGFVFSVRRDLGLPVRFVGLGEGPDDLAPFSAAAFVDGFLGLEAAGMAV